MKNKKTLIKKILIFMLVGIILLTSTIYGIERKDAKCENLKLSDRDFSITVNGVNISPYSNFRYIEKEIGVGDSSEVNNYGFIGYSDDGKYKYFNHNYLYENEKLSITTKMDIVTGEVSIYKIEIFNIATSREIKNGNSKKQVLCKYGTPNIQSYDKLIYNYKDKEMIFNLKDFKVTSIIFL